MEGQRPRTMAQMRRALSGFATEAGVARGLAYRPDPTDVFISPYAKCGTTWMQQIVHGLRSGGDMGFSEITEVVPWIELAHDMGMADPAHQRFAPRAFKSHCTWDSIPKGGRYIVVFRDPADAMVSLWRFFDGWFFEAGAIGLEDFAAYYLDDRDGEDWWSHAASWWAMRERPEVLLLAYEEMRRDLPGTVDRVAGFIGVSDPAAREVAMRQAGFAFMKAHAGQFDDHLVRRTRDAACGLPEGGESSKVSQGQTGAGQAQLSDRIRAALDARWRATLGARFGLRDYGHLLAALDG